MESKRIKRAFPAVLALLIIVAGLSGAFAWEGEGPLIIDHACSDLSKIPPAWIDSTKAKMRLYYGHMSHGMQVTEGLRRIEEVDPFFGYAVATGSLPSEADAFCVHDILAEPQEYFSTVAGMNLTRAALNSYPETNFTMFGWCSELQTWSEGQVQAYLDSMEVLEAEFPDVTFIYATGHAQFEGYDGQRRKRNNDIIRAYCVANDKVLYDFADMDAWWYNPATSSWEQNTYEFQGETILLEHPQLVGADWGHTSFESCEQKGRTMWWLVTMLSGWWDDDLTSTEATTLGGLKKRFRR